MRSLAYTQVLGKPLILYFGILTLLSFSLTALVGFLNYKGNRSLPFKWHPRLAVLSLTLAAIHALMGILSYF